MQTLTQVFTRAGGWCNNHRCHNKKTQIENVTGDVNDVMAGSDGLGLLVILNKSSELIFELRLSELIFWTWARPDQLVDCRMRVRVGWVSELKADDRRTVSIEKLCVSLSSCRKPKLKEGNKSFVSEPRESPVFRVFREFHVFCYVTRLTFSFLSKHSIHLRFYYMKNFHFELTGSDANILCDD